MKDKTTERLIWIFITPLVVFLFREHWIGLSILLIFLEINLLTTPFITDWIPMFKRNKLTKQSGTVNG